MSRRNDIDHLDASMAVVTGMHILNIMIYLACYWILWVLAGDWMVMTFDQLWQPEASIYEAIGKVWFIFVWALVLNTLNYMRVLRRGERTDHEPSEYIIKGWWISLNAGFFEELIYRWILFFNLMVVIRALDTVTNGLIEWIYTMWLIPLANWATLDSLAPQLVDSPEWLLGAALISANSAFRDGHSYQGWFGYVNSWFIGMVFFWLMFNYGLMSAIVAHILYDMLIFTVGALASAAQPRSRLNMYFR